MSYTSNIWLYPLHDWWRAINQMLNFMHSGEMGSFIFHPVSKQESLATVYKTTVFYYVAFRPVQHISVRFLCMYLLLVCLVPRRTSSWSWNNTMFIAFIFVYSHVYLYWVCIFQHSIRTCLHQNIIEIHEAVFKDMHSSRKLRLPSLLPWPLPNFILQL